MCVDLSTPMTVGDIVSIVATVFTLIAIGVATHGNCQSKDQFKKNMKKQEQAINLSLFDARNEILEKVKGTDFSFSMDRVSFLFDKKTVRLITVYNEISEDIGIKIRLQLAYQIQVKNAANYSDKNSEERDYGEYFNKYLRIPLKLSVSDDKYQEMRERIRARKIYIDGLPQIPAGNYSYIDLEDELSRLYTEQKSTKEQIIKSMKTQIEQSVPRTE